ncbi:MAG TPA: histidine kinase [Pseudonocardiaceae bacterium]|jgi:signal transduction histidine kinase
MDTGRAPGLLEWSRQPWKVVLIVLGAALLVFAARTGGGPFGYQMTPATLVVWVVMLAAAYAIARSGTTRGRQLIGSAAVVLSILVSWWSMASTPHGGGDVRWDILRNGVFVALTLGTAWMLGKVVHARSETEQVRAAAERAKVAEHDRAVAADERARIARELHDITAHHISVVALQAGTARLLAEAGRHPEPETLAAIENTARQAMIEIRQALGVIRSTPDGAAPLPGLAQLPDLASGLESAGLTVTITGDTGTLPGGLDLTAYRIVQEGLANVARHSAARTAEVVFRREAALLDISITDAGPARQRPAAGSGGHGLVGVRERVRHYGGRCAAGPLPDGGFRVRVALPLPERSAR